MHRTRYMRVAFCAAAIATLITNQTVAQSASEYDTYEYEGAESEGLDEGSVLEIDDSGVEPAQFLGGGVGVGFGGGLDFGLLTHGCDCQLVFGAEYLYARANYSQAISYVEQNLVDPLQPRVIFNQFDYDYNSSYRLYGGYRICECACALMFTYTQLDSGASFTSPVVPGDTSRQFFAPLEVVADVPGTSLNGRANVRLNAYDIAFSKTIPLGCPLGCCCKTDCCGDSCCDTCCDTSCDAGGCCDDCCGDSCGCNCCCWCPAWDITWTAGVRIADVESEFGYANVIPANPALQQTSVARQTFEGAGLRWGMIGRRYFGSRGIGSLYVKGDLSLLLGDHTTITDSVVGTALSRHEISCTHIITVTEIEVGGSVCVTRNIQLSGGYFFSAWHDLGYRVEYPFSTQPTGVQLEAFDDANILGFDGFFARAEVAF